MKVTAHHSAHRSADGGAHGRVASMREEFVALRKRLGSQVEVAAMLERSVQWLCQIEQGKRPPPAYALYALRYLASEAEPAASISQ